MNNDDIRAFLLRHRRIMTDEEFGEIAGISGQAVGQFINKSCGRTDGNTFRTNKIHEALGLKVESVTYRTFKPKEAL